MKYSIFLFVAFLIMTSANESYSTEILSTGTGLLKEKRSSKWNGSSWETRASEQYSYNLKNQKEIVTVLKPFQNILKLISRTKYSYDENGLVSEMVIDSLKDEGWVNSCRYSLTYDNSGLLVSSLSEKWDGNEWISESKIVNNYNVNNQLLSSMVCLYTNNNWENSSVINVTYTTFGKISQQTEQIWLDGIWKNFRNRCYLYNDNQSVKDITAQIWKTKWWVNVYDTLYTYDASDKIIELQYSIYQNDKWETTGKSEIKYDIGNNITQEIISLFNNGNWENSVEYDYDYGTTGINESGLASNLKLEAYPNPASDMITLKYNLNQPSFVKISISDVMGMNIKVIYEGTNAGGSSDKTSFIKELPQGNYFIQFKCNDKVSTIPLKIIR